MIKKKSGFWAFICSMVPGAGEMYLGFMKEGLSIMTLAFAIFVFSIWMDMGWLISIVGIIWFYSVFNVHNKMSLPDEEFYALEDDYLFHMDQIIPRKEWNGQQNKVFGWCMTFMGLAMLWRPIIRNFLYILSIYIPEEVVSVIRSFLYSLPRFLFAIVLIYCGQRLIWDKKKQLEMEPEMEDKN